MVTSKRNYKVIGLRMPEYSNMIYASHLLFMKIKVKNLNPNSYQNHQQLKMLKSNEFRKNVSKRKGKHIRAANVIGDKAAESVMYLCHSLCRAVSCQPCAPNGRAYKMVSHGCTLKLVYTATALWKDARTFICLTRRWHTARATRY